MSELINPQQAYEKFIQTVKSLEEEVTASKLRLISLQTSLEEHKESYNKAVGALKIAEDSLEQVTQLIESSNTSWDAKRSELVEKYENEANLRLKALDKAKTDYFAKGYEEAEADIKKDYKLTKKKTAGKPQSPTKVKPKPIYDSVVKARAKKKIANKKDKKEMD